MVSSTMLLFAHLRRGLLINAGKMTVHEGVTGLLGGLVVLSNARVTGAKPAKEVHAGSDRKVSGSTEHHGSAAGFPW